MQDGLMMIVKYLLSIGSLLTGFILMSIKDAYQNVIMSLFCSMIYKFGPNAVCDMLLGLPDLGLLFLAAGIFGLLLSLYIDFADHQGSMM
jgi:hypothetical protein